MKWLAGPADAIDLIPAGATIVVHSACGEPLLLTEALAREGDALPGATLTMLMPMGPAPYADGRFGITSFFPGKALRKPFERGLVSLRRDRLSTIPGLFSGSTALPADILLLQLSEPDADGRMSLGLSVDYMPAILARRPLVIAHINPDFPRTQGDAFVTERQVDHAFHAPGPVQTMADTQGDALERRIADHVAELVRDGDVLQLGIGALPSMILARLRHRRLAVHSGIVTDGLRPLVECGAIEGVVITTMAAGTADFYRWLHDNPAFSFQPCDRTHDPATIARIGGMTAINSVLEIDLSGQANAECVDGRIISAPGGLPDFAYAASAAPSGRSIVALRSTSKDGLVSRIVHRLADGTPVTLTADGIDYLVTEHGTARLTGLQGQALANAILEVAHPDLRGALRRPEIAG